MVYVNYHMHNRDSGEKKEGKVRRKEGRWEGRKEGERKEGMEEGRDRLERYIISYFSSFLI